MNMKASPVPAVEPIKQSAVPEPRKTDLVQRVEQKALYRLVIEQGPAPGSFVYKTLDRETGEVVRQFPREDVAKLKGLANYGPGGVIDTTV